MLQNLFRIHRACYCAHCRSERLVYQKRHVSLSDVGLALIASALASFICWQDLDPRALLFFAVGVGTAELFIVVRWRLSIACPSCGFDPVLYKKNPQLANERVKDFTLMRRQDPFWVPKVKSKASPK